MKFNTLAGSQCEVVAVIARHIIGCRVNLYTRVNVSR